MRKQQICVLSSLQPEDLRSLSELKNISDEVIEIDPKAVMEIESN